MKNKYAKLFTCCIKCNKKLKMPSQKGLCQKHLIQEFDSKNKQKITLGDYF